MFVKVISFLFFVIPIFSQNNISFNYDYSSFLYDSNLSRLELYYSFDKTTIESVQEAGKNYVTAGLKIEITEENKDSIIFSKDYSFNSEFTENESDKFMIGKLDLYLMEGKYNFTLTGYDVNDSLNFTKVEDLIEVESFVSDSIKISDIELALQISKSDIESIFNKNHYEVIPNAMLYYSDSNPVAYYYVELYNLPVNKVLDYEEGLLDGDGNVIYKKGKKLKTANGNVVLVGFVNLKKYATNSYTFVFNLISDGVGHTKFKKLFYYNSTKSNVNNRLASANSILESEFAVYTAEECDNHFDLIKYISNQQEINKYKELTSIEGKRTFLHNFWVKRDPKPQTELNEFKIEYLKRFKECEEKFKTIYNKGYKTDMGRVYMIYGKPDRIERSEVRSGQKSIQEWYYDSIEGGVMFIFGDLKGFRQYELIHSTMRGELYDPNWRDRIDPLK